MKKIVIITNIMSPYRVDLFNYLNHNFKFDITIIYSAQNEDNRQWEIENINHKYKILKSKTIKIKKKLDYKYIHFPLDIIKTLDTINPDVIIGSEYNPTVIISYMWAKLRNIKYISWSDGTLNSERFINKFQKKMRNIICKNSDALIASSTKTMEAQRYYGAEKNIFLSYLTIDVEKYKNKKEEFNNKRIICVGSLIKRKGVDLLFNALSLVKSDYSLDIVGSGEEEENLKQLAKDLGIHNKVNFLGFKKNSDIFRLYEDADIFVIPTREDCFGLVINEAMCCSLPIISSKYADGSYDLVDDDINGYIIDPYDSESFAEKIDTLLSNNELVRRFGINSYNKIESFKIEKVAKEYVNAIEFVLE